MLLPKEVQIILLRAASNVLKIQKSSVEKAQEIYLHNVNEVPASFEEKIKFFQFVARRKFTRWIYKRWNLPDPEFSVKVTKEPH